jgi:hypothetical protein
MPATTRVRDFLWSVCTTLQDISPQYQRWTERELVVYTNYGQLAIFKFLPQAGSATDAIRLRPGSLQDFSVVTAGDIRPGDGSSPTEKRGFALMGMTRNMGADGQTPGRVVRVGDRYTLDTNDPDWHTRSGTVVREFIFDPKFPRRAYVNPPVPASPAVWVEVEWMVEPSKIPDGGAPNAPVYAFDGSSTTLLGIADQNVEDLHNYVVAMALLKGSKNVQNVPKAQLHGQAFTTSINAQAEIVTGVNPNLKALPFIDQINAGAA